MGRTAPPDADIGFVNVSSGDAFPSSRPDGAALRSYRHWLGAGLPLHGANLFPDAVPELKPAVLRFMREAERSAHAIMEGVALSLGLDVQYFCRTYTAKSTLLFRIFEYPADDGEGWGVGEHTDYGLLTLLAQDQHRGLQVNDRGFHPRRRLRRRRQGANGASNPARPFAGEHQD
jgi:isopenicillin N synthase-like dioxygenase